MIYRYTARSALTNPASASRAARLALAAGCVLLTISACGGSDPGAAEVQASSNVASQSVEPSAIAEGVPTTAPIELDSATEAESGSEAGTEAEGVEEAGTEAESGSEAGTEAEGVEEGGTEAESGSEAGTEAESAEEATTADIAPGCDEVALLFVTRGSANADLDDPEVEANCVGADIVIASNGIPDYTYVETSPGQPTDRDHTFTIPATPTLADEVTDVPALGTAGVTLGGIPIFGPTEGTGGDVESLPGILSECGSHNGPSGFHIHLILTSSETDCLFTPEEVAAQPQLVGFAFDGFPIYTGADQYTSSWQLTDESLFAIDTWAAHSYVEGSGDLDQCNGRRDDDGNYAYYTTSTFPYILGCFAGVVDLDAARGGAGAGDADRPERPEAEGDLAERPEGDEDRPERPATEGDLAERPEGDEDRPARPEGGDDRPERPERPEGQGAPGEGGEGA